MQLYLGIRDELVSVTSLNLRGIPHASLPLPLPWNIRSNLDSRLVPASSGPQKLQSRFIEIAASYSEAAARGILDNIIAQAAGYSDHFNFSGGDLPASARCVGLAPKTSPARSWSEHASC